MSGQPACPRGLSPTLYGRVAGVYDTLGNWYTGGQIVRLKEQQLCHLNPGQRVLYAGVGTGQELVGAVARGAVPTALDSSPEMLDRARRRLVAPGSVRFCCEDVFAHRPSQPYDVVVANFFLNVFSSEAMPRVLEHLARCLRPGGSLLIGDFAPPTQGSFTRGLQRAYYLPPLLLFWMLTNNAWHPLYDYRLRAAGAGLELVGHDTLRIFGSGPAWLSTLRFHKLDNGYE